ncbi:MAG: HAD family hydrolase [Brotaphodocola sp.]
MNKKYILFDLDGTLTDSREGIINSVIYALQGFGIEVENQESLLPFIGPPLLDSFQKYYGFDRSQAQEGLKRYRQYFSETGIFENQVYDGIENLLKELNHRAYKLLLATSKPEIYAKRIMDHFGLSPYFAFIGGASMDESRINKADVIRYVLKENHIADLSEVVMVGDRCHDVEGAKQNGLEVIGVLYGYGSLEELQSAGADCIAETPMDVLRVLET